MKLIKLTLCFVAAVGVVSCGDEDLTGGNKLSEVLNTPTYTQSITLSDSEQSANEAINNYSVDLFMRILQNSETDASIDANSNLSISPISAVMSIGLIASTCSESEGDIIAKALNCNDAQTLTDVCNKLMLYLPNTDNGAYLTLANSVWFDSTVQPSSKYVKSINSLFNAEVYSTDLSSNSIVQQVNAWVAKKTDNKILNLMSEPTQQKALLCNTMYFFGEWHHKFDKDLTVEAPFYGTEGTSVVQMMTNSANDFYYMLDDCRALSLKLKREQSEIIFVLPNEDVDFATFCKSFDSVKYNDLLATLMPNVEVDMSIPKFNIEESINLIGQYNYLGIPTIITLEKAGIDNEVEYTIKQKVLTSIDEDGATLAAATIFGPATEVLPDLKAKFELNRPFLYFVRNAITGTILMAGRVCNI